MGTFEAIGAYIIKSDRLKTVLLGLLLLTGGLWFWLYLLGNPLNELALIRRGVTAKGVITDVGASYEFRLPNGQMIKGETGVITYYPPEYNIEVEYRPDDPSVSRIKGDGCSTVREWLWRNVGLLILFFSPGVGLILWGFRRKPKGPAL